MRKILKYKNTILIFSFTLILLSVISISVFGFRPGIDFTSGSLWQVKMQKVDDSLLRNFFSSELGVSNINISFDSANQAYTFTLKEITESERQAYLTKLQQKFGNEVESLDFWTISPSVSQELRKKAFWAIGLVLVGISLYIAFAFRKVSEPVRSWKYGLATLFALLHDVLIPAGVFALLGFLAGITVDTNFIVAMLFVMGFSVHDTIVVFDRIRENLLIAKEERKSSDRLNLEGIIDKSILETIVRSINTTLTLVIMLVALYFFGPITTKFFILAILIGTIAGTYSSIFVASPLLIFFQKFSRRPQK
jgi:preprotein translocase subunit SecF